MLFSLVHDVYGDRFVDFALFFTKRGMDVWIRQISPKERSFVAVVAAAEAHYAQKSRYSFQMYPSHMPSLERLINALIAQYKFRWEDIMALNLYHLLLWWG
jgi:hypothetical protein